MLQLSPRDIDVRDMYNVESFSDGRGIVAKDAQDALIKVAGSDSRFAWALRPDAIHAADDNDLVGRAPPPGAVGKVIKAAFECSAEWHPMANWNLEVYQRILDIAFRPTEDSDFENLIDFMGSTIASIIPEYSIPSLLKKADFCVYIEPENDPSTSPAFQTGASYGRATLLEEVLNVTDFLPLCDRFVALSIKTQKSSDDFEAAQLQLGVWDIARWALLRRLSREGSQLAPCHFNHGWRQDGALAGSIGSTSQPRGVCKIIRMLQYLEKRAKDVHWPGLWAIIEGIPGADA